MTGCDCETSTIDTIESHIEERKTCLVEDLMDRRERVVLKVLVAHGVVGGQAQHRGHVRLLEMPDAVGGQAVSNVTRKCDGALEVVEHRDRRHDARRHIAHFSELLRRKEVWHDFGVGRVVRREPRGRRIDADKP